jgi:hypothetical protein
MTRIHVDFLVEEPSMEVFLRELLPRVLPDLPFEVYPFHGKDEMLERLPQRLRGYAAWRPEGRRIVVLVDRDRDECHELKQRLESFAHDAGLTTRSQPCQGSFFVANRIAIEELEAWYFGDWQAVCAAYPRVSRTADRRAGFRDPDSIAGGTWEAFERVLKRAGYFATGLRKREAARAIAPHFEPARNKSHSFQVFHQVLLELQDQGRTVDADNGYE